MQLEISSNYSKVVKKGVVEIGYKEKGADWCCSYKMLILRRVITSTFLVLHLKYNLLPNFIVKATFVTFVYLNLFNFQRRIPICTNVPMQG